MKGKNYEVNDVPRTYFKVSVSAAGKLQKNGSKSRAWFCKETHKGSSTTAFIPCK